MNMVLQASGIVAHAQCHFRWIVAVNILIKTLLQIWLQLAIRLE